MTAHRSQVGQSRTRWSVAVCLCLLLSAGCSRKTGATIQEKSNPYMNWTIPAIWSIGTVGAAAATHGDTFYKNGKKYERFELTDVCFVLDASGASRVSCKGK